MVTASGQVMTLANSIIGVGILAMPFCFQKCGILLGIVLLIASNCLTRVSCHYLIKASILTRKRNFEYLAFHAFGSSGKLMVELCIIGYLMGTCIAYFVVVGDLGPQIISKLFNINNTINLRTLIMVIVTILCVIPLGLLKNVDSLAALCTASIGFYCCLVVKIILESRENILSGDFLDKVDYWRPSGILQCLPIFSMALSCQMQIFEVYDTMPNASLEKMNETVKSATNICSVVYILVGVFGYIAYCTQEFSGNILLNFSPSALSEIIKIGFVLSVAFSFPLVIFPCRASLYSLIYKRGYSESLNYIPSNKFTWITLTIVVVGLMIGLLIPSVELVIGLVGSTIGVAICIMFPSSCFHKVSKKDSFEKMFAQFILFFGFTLMILGTYANLNAIDEKQSGSHLVELDKFVIVHPTVTVPEHIEPQLKIELDSIKDEVKLKEVLNIEPNKVTEASIIPNPVEVRAPDNKVKEIMLNASAVVEKAVEKKDEIDKKAIEKEENEINKGENENVEEAQKEKEKITFEIEKLKETKIQLEKEVQDIKNEVSKQTIEVNKQTDLNEDKTNTNIKKEADPVIQLLSAEKMLNPQKDLYILQNENKLNRIESHIRINETIAQVPLSYKIGEIIEQNKTILSKIIQPIIQPIPIAVLSSSSKTINQTAPVASKLSHQQPAVAVPVKNVAQTLPEQPNDNKLIESIRRDLLEVNTNNEENSTPLNVKREKRDAECNKPDKLLVDPKLFIESNIKLMGRDLKSVDENKKK